MKMVYKNSLKKFKKVSLLELFCFFGNLKYAPMIFGAKFVFDFKFSGHIYKAMHT